METVTKYRCTQCRNLHDTPEGAQNCMNMHEVYRQARREHEAKVAACKHKFAYSLDGSDCDCWNCYRYIERSCELCSLTEKIDLGDIKEGQLEIAFDILNSN